MMWEKAPDDVIGCVFNFVFHKKKKKKNTKKHKKSLALQATENGCHKQRPGQICLPRGHKASDQFSNQGLGI